MKTKTDFRTQKNEITVSIIAGKLKNKRIFLPDTPLTRPSKSIVRGSIFDTLQEDVRNHTFIEMFAGSGSIGFEALSRGVDEVIFMEKEEIPLKILKTNSNILVKTEIIKKEQINIIFGDSFLNLSTALKNAKSQVILYLDPPFSIRENMENIYTNLFKVLENLTEIEKQKIDLIILEHLTLEQAPKSLAEKELIKNKKFGKTTISYFI